MKVDIKIDKQFINKLIEKVYKNKIPRNSILIHSLILLKQGNVTSEYYKVNNLYIRDDDIYYSNDTNDNVNINVSSIDDYSPLLEFFKYKNIKFEKSTISKDLYTRSEEILEFILSSNGMQDDCTFISNNDLIFYNYINDIKNNNNDIGEKLYLFLNNKNVDPDFLPKEYLKNSKNKITINIQL